MGMFDYMRVKAPLPVEGFNDFEFQTKSFKDPWMDHYEIREDGTLWRETYDIEDRSDPTAPEGSPERFIGCMTRVNQQQEAMPDFTGNIQFYNSIGDRGWIEFKATIVDGKLYRPITLVSHLPDKPLAE